MYIFVSLIVFVFLPSIFALDSANLEKHLTYLASDKLEGRGPGTAGIDSAANYIADVFKKNGLKPGGDDNSYFQKMNVKYGVKAGAENRLKFDGKSYQFDKSYVPLGFSGNGRVNGNIAFAGYGIVDDDFDAIDLTDKIALILTGLPEDNDSTESSNNTEESIHANLRSKVINAKTRGAAAVIFIDPANPVEASDFLPALRSSRGYHDVGIPVIQMTRNALRDALDENTLQKLLKNTVSKQQRNELLKNVRAELRVDLKAREAALKNVIGIFPGSDDSLNQAPLIIGAHYDHLGYGGPGSKAPGVHAIHNGADDNASGVAALLKLSEKFTKSDQEIKRPVVFIAFTAEEIGMIGSTYFVKHPLYPLEKVVAMLNLDTVGRMTENELIIFGSGTATQWQYILNGYNHKHQLELVLRPEGNSPSDHAIFYTHKIPVLHFFSGANEDYHKPSDDVEKINFQGLTKIADFVFDVSQYLVQREEPLTFKVSGKERHQAVNRRSKAGNRPWLGTVPDFTYQKNDGLKLSGVSAGSPCEKAGLQPGDLITRIDNTDINSIYELNHVLKNHKPGDEILVTYLREGEKKTVEIVLAER
ncbi:M20/M25/M40 family metallo-hydrolase [candidate division KSB1 bacterium]|nr:M20/M25/M40 family metallo-hydrolase [candidate division KSB1 bacterium]